MNVMELYVRLREDFPDYTTDEAWGHAERIHRWSEQQAFKADVERDLSALPTMEVNGVETGAEKRIRQLEETVAVLVVANSELRVTNAELGLDNAQLRARLRVVELMEEQAANRLGFQIPMRPAEPQEGHSLRAVEG